MKSLMAMFLLLGVMRMEAENKPSIQECREDLTKWTDFTDESKDKFQNALTLKEIFRRQQVMAECNFVDTSIKDTALKNAYWDAFHVYGNWEDFRIGTFLKRHNLYEQLYKEDEAGAR